jgi:exopolyphosphatase / guanosine-5'-triphosphate,3'-diphosphate pyrophosphatase
MRIGIIDLGSNSIRLVIYFWDGIKVEKKQDIKHQAQSIKFIKDQKMSQDGIDSIVMHLKELMVMARAYDVDELKIFATASLRNISNSNEAKAEIENKIMASIDILNGHEESIFGFEGMKKVVSLPLEGISIDIGGGSSEITYFKNKIAVYTDSIPIGSLSLYLDHVVDVVPNDFEQVAMRHVIQNALDNLIWLENIKVETLIGIGGTARAVMKLHQARYEINSSIYDMRISSSIVHSIATLNKRNKTSELSLIVDVIPDRLTTVFPGALILDEVMRKVEAQEYLLSQYGVREGYMYNRILQYKNGESKIEPRKK